MSDPTFTRTTGQPLFFLPLSGMPDGYSIGFLPAVDPSGNSLTLGATWTTNPGLYLFLGEPSADQATLVSAVRSYVGSRAVQFLWIANPQDEVARWRASEIDVNPASFQVTPPATIGFRNIVLAIGGGSTVGLNGTSDALVVTAASGATIDLLTDFGSDSLATGGGVTIAFGGAAAGCLGFTLAVTQTQLAQLDPGCRFFFSDTASPVPGATTSVRFPVIDLGSASMMLYAGLDPIHPNDPARTAFNFLASPSGTGPTLASGFRTVYGETVMLTPTTSTVWPNGPALVFAVRPSFAQASEADPYYTTFEGPFVLSTSSVQTVARMMCGYSGIEYAGLASGAVNQLAFVSGQPAFARLLRQTDVVSDAVAVTDPVPLTMEATTAWCVLSAPAATALQYFSQPHASVLYQALPTIEATPEAFLYYLEVFAGTFPDPARSNAVPMAPFGMLDPVDAAHAVALETQIVSPYRRNRLATILVPTENGTSNGDRLAATPQGLLLSLSDNLAYWKLLTLGQANAGAQKLQLASITGGFKSALQSNQLFAVVSNWQEFTRRCTAVLPFNITISGWTFDLSPANWAAHQTIVLFKYAADATIDELTADTGTWAWSDAASGYDDVTGNLATTQADIRAMFAAAKAEAVKRPELRPFVDAITNPNWNGFLFLRAPLATSDFPDQLRGIAAGIDPARLFAHHVGVSVAPVHNVNQQLVQEDASIFALIDYADPVNLADTAVEYAFKVLGLTVLFRNSMMASFSSRIELLINRLFGGQTSQRTPGAAGNNIVLDGFYQSANGVPAYVFVMSKTSVYAMVDRTLDTIDITRAQFITLTPTDSTQSTVQTQFVLDGRLRFNRLSDFDVFSFGPLLSEDGALMQDGYLQFANLLVEMSFPDATPQQTSFRFNARAIAFDISRSVPRADSLFSHFPLQLTGLLQAAPEATPRGNGYTPVGSPLPNSELHDPWFALTFDLTLGSAGALAGSSGIVVQLGAAWSSDESSPRTFVGLRLPGGGGSSTALMLQGVIGLTFRAIEFTAEPSEQGIDYILRFRGVALRLFTLSFPPGQIDLTVFGDPSGSRSGVIGWYAAYAKKDDTKKAPEMTRRRNVP